MHCCRRSIAAFNSFSLGRTFRMTAVCACGRFPEIARMAARSVARRDAPGVDSANLSARWSSRNSSSRSSFGKDVAGDAARRSVTPESLGNERLSIVDLPL